MRTFLRFVSALVVSLFLKSPLLATNVAFFGFATAMNTKPIPLATEV